MRVNKRKELVQSAWSKKVLVTHSASSCTNPVNYLEVYEPTIYPFWANNPPKLRLVSAPYKTINDPSIFLPYNSLMFKVRNLRRLPCSSHSARSSCRCAKPFSWVHHGRSCSDLPAHVYRQLYNTVLQLCN